MLSMTETFLPSAGRFMLSLRDWRITRPTVLAGQGELNYFPLKGKRLPCPETRFKLKKIIGIITVV